MKQIWIHILKLLIAGGKKISACRRIVLPVLLVSLQVCGAVDAGQEKSAPTEYQVKAAYLFNFAKFVEWPAQAFSDAQAPFVLGILGDDPFGDAFDSVQGKPVKGRTFMVKKFKDVEKITTCHILFISASEKGRWQTIFKVLQQKNVLLVGDVEGFAKAGGVANVIAVNKIVSLEVNVDNAARNGLTFSSRILNMARIVHGAPGREGD